MDMLLETASFGPKHSCTCNTSSGDIEHGSLYGCSGYMMLAMPYMCALSTLHTSTFKQLEKQSIGEDGIRLSVVAVKDGLVNSWIRPCT